eukprot:Tamp_11901.p1 GENE.Tamp_11901~~Tamp_11901.p1  ORF type:complete len:527 (-),score=71.49 Tamp_11901:146-1726(-)
MCGVRACACRSATRALAPRARSVEPSPDAPEGGAGGSAQRRGRKKKTPTEPEAAAPEEDPWAAIRERSFLGPGPKQLTAVSKKIAKASLLIKHAKIARVSSGEDCEDSTLSDVARRKGMSKQCIAQLQSTGYGDHHVGTLECLGLVDKETIRNLTRTFGDADKEEKEQRRSNPRSPSPDSRHQQESSPEEKQLKGASAISDVMPTDLFHAGQVGASEDQNMQNKEQDQEVAPPRRSRSKLAALLAPGTIRVCTESEPRPQTGEQPTASYETVEGTVNSRRPASAYLPWGKARTAPKLEDKSLHKNECEGGLLGRPARPMSGHALSRLSGAAHVRSAVRTLLQDLNAGSDSAMRSILKLSRDNQQETEQVFCELSGNSLQIQNIPKGPSVQSPLVLHKISLDSFKVNMQLVADVTGELNTLKIVYEGGSEVTRHKEKEVKGINMKRRTSEQYTASHGSLLQAPAHSLVSMKAAVQNKKHSISLTSPDAKLIKRWHTALREAWAASTSNGPALRRSATMLPHPKSSAI